MTRGNDYLWTVLWSAFLMLSAAGSGCCNSEPFDLNSAAFFFLSRQSWTRAAGGKCVSERVPYLTESWPLLLGRPVSPHQCNSQNGGWASHIALLCLHGGCASGMTCIFYSLLWAADCYTPLSNTSWECCISAKLGCVFSILWLNVHAYVHVGACAQILLV